MKKRLLSILLTACLLVGLLPTVALPVALAAEDGVMYLDENGAEQIYTGSYTEITSSTYWKWTTGWYVVNSNVTFSYYPDVEGDVHLILADNCSLSVGYLFVNSGNSLTIYAQSTGSNMGKLNAGSTTEQYSAPNAGIGGSYGSSGGVITINGGYVTASGYCGAGIGGGGGSSSSGDGGAITINGGTVIATSILGAGIGGGGTYVGGNGGDGGRITINGGTVIATSTRGAGIGGGYGYYKCGNGADVTITGGTVTATTTNQHIAAIGWGDGNSDPGGRSPGTLIITGGDITPPAKYYEYDDIAGIKPEGDSNLVAFGNLTLPVDLTIPEGKALTIPSGASLTIPEGKTLINKGTIINNGTLTNNGTIINNGGTLTNNSTFKGNTPKNGVSAAYLDETGTKQTCDTSIVVESSDTTWGDDGKNGWYVVQGTVEIGSRVTVTGDVHLILADNCDFTVTGGIRVEAPNALTIYAQSTVESTMGKLTAGAQYEDSAAIGGNGGTSGTITINGGIVEATSNLGAGIGSGTFDGGTSGTITINDGIVTATSNYGAAIGGGAGPNGNSGGNGGTITINGGTVTATVTVPSGTDIHSCGAAIGGGGGGIGGNGGNITISGGTVIATVTVPSGTDIDGCGAAIGGGGGGTGGNGGNITICGGTVTATATGTNSGAGIGGGGGFYSNGGSGTFQTQKENGPNGNAVIFASSIGDTSNQSSWSGVIFEGDEGKVYGSAVTPIEDFTIDSDKILLIPESAALTIAGITAVNSGSVYVDGTVSGLGGDLYYPLTVDGGTASGDVSTYQSKNYGKANGTVTLTGTNIPEGQVVDSWTTSVSTVTVADNTFTMPNSALTATASYANALTITTQPTASQAITYGETTTLSVAAKNYLNTTDGLTYQWYQVEGSTETALNGETSSSLSRSGLTVGTYTYCCKVTYSGITVTSNTATVTVNPLAEAAPAISIDYENETLTGFVSGRNYAINGTAVTTVDGKLSVVDYIGSDISIVTKASDSNHADSTAQTLTIPARPVAPSPVGVNETVDGKNDGQITNVDNTMAYRKGVEGSWTACTGTAVTDLTPGTYQVRVKATSTSFASAAADVTIATGDAKTYTLNITSTHTFTDAAYGYTQPVAQDITITSSGNWDSTIASVTVDSNDFTIGGSGSTVASGGSIDTWTVQPAAGLAAGSYTATITVTYNDGATATAPVSFTVTKAAQTAPSSPTVKSKTYNSVTLNDIEDSTQSGAKAQYSMDGGTTWQDSPEFNDLTPSTAYSFVAQYRETDNYFASPVSTELSVTTNAAPSSGGSTYAITVESAKNGTVTVAPKTAVKGATVTITVEPDKGYTLETLTVTDKNGNEIELTNKGDGKYTFTMPASKVTVTATFMENNSMLNFFVDVFPGDYYYDAVLWAAENGITSGVDDTHFAPNAPCTRAQMVTFLWRAAGCPTPKSSEMPFTDVVKGSYYETAVLWAVENGITYGTSATTFAPDAICNRAQFATFLWRSQGKPGAGTSNPFTDVAEGTYYTDAVLWAAENGITEGTSSTTFSPYDNCTRAQTVTFLYRCLGK